MKVPSYLTLSPTKYADNLTKQVLEVYRLASIFYKKQDEKSYIKAFQTFINITPLLKVRWSTVEKAYFKKLGENYNPQDNNY